MHMPHAPHAHGDVGPHISGHVHMHDAHAHIYGFKWHMHMHMHMHIYVHPMCTFCMYKAPFRRTCKARIVRIAY